MRSGSLAKESGNTFSATSRFSRVIAGAVNFPHTAGSQQ